MKIVRPQSDEIVRKGRQSLTDLTTYKEARNHWELHKKLYPESTLTDLYNTFLELNNSGKSDEKQVQGEVQSPAPL
jgi:hypothetical protein